MSEAQPEAHGAAPRVAPQTDATGRPPYTVQVPEPLLHIEDYWLSYGETPAVRGITLEIPRRRVTAFIGPSGCGKSTLLRSLNRMNDLVPGVRVGGSIRLDDMELLSPEVDVIELRRRVGMVFQAYYPFPKSIYENVVYGLRVGRVRNKALLDEAAERSLRGAGLWDEVKDRLHEHAYGLSGGQMQRLCIARAIAVNPEVILMDEPCSALDPVATARVEDLIEELKSDYTVVIVTHNMQQAARVSEYTAFLYMGQLVEYNETDTLFTRPARQQTQDYVTGRFG